MTKKEYSEAIAKLLENLKQSGTGPAKLGVIQALANETESHELGDLITKIAAYKDKPDYVLPILSRRKATDFLNSLIPASTATVEADKEAKEFAANKGKRETVGSK